MDILIYSSLSPCDTHAIISPILQMRKLITEGYVTSSKSHNWWVKDFELTLAQLFIGRRNEMIFSVSKNSLSITTTV